MALKYTIQDICEFNAITQSLYDAEGSDTIPIRTLLDLYETREKFNIEYIRYITNKYLHDIASYIYDKTRYNVTYNPRLRADIQNNNLNREHYDSWIEYYKNKNDDYTEYATIDEIIRENNIPVLYYFYYKEEEELTQIIINYLNDFNDRKFFIIH